MNSFTDPRILPCIHTFCFECLKSTAEAEQKKPEEKMSCPICRKEFTIPFEGIIGLQKNFFMENIVKFKNTMQSNTPTLQTGTEKEEEKIQNISVKFCNKHKQKLLDYYCADCKKLVCVSCFVESHSLHECKDVASVEEEFRQTIKRFAWKMTNYADEIMLMKKNADTKKTDFLKKIEVVERATIMRNQELKDRIDEHTKSLLDELSVKKAEHLKEMEIHIEEIDRCCTILKSFESYCTEFVVKGSASDICSSVDEIILREEKLEREHEEFIVRPQKSVEVFYQATNLKDVLLNANNNLVGSIRVKTETKRQFEAFVLWLKSHRDVMKVNLHRPNEISRQEDIPTQIYNSPVAAVYCNTMYVTGIGDKNAEIWKYNMTSRWVKCASLVQGRHSHSAAFIDEVLYICGGIDYRRVLNSVEAFNAVTEKCIEVGKLVHCVKSTSGCVSLRRSLYIFGGESEDGINNNPCRHVQVYNTKDNSCTVFSKPMPLFFCLHAVLWKSSAILVGIGSCFIFDTEAETWTKRKWAKTKYDVYNSYDLVLDNERLVAFDRKEVRYVPLRNILDDKPIEWKIHATQPAGYYSDIDACVKLRLLV